MDEGMRMVLIIVQSLIKPFRDFDKFDNRS